MLESFSTLSRYYNSIAHTRVCDGTSTPEALIVEAKYALTDITLNRKDILRRSLDWLAKPVPVQMHERIMGRVYTTEEKSRLASERVVAQRLPCPYLATNGRCLLGMTRPLSCRVSRDQYADYAGNLALKLKPFGCDIRWGFLPALLAIELDKQAVIALIQEGKVADAKIALVNRPELEVIATQR